LLLISLALQKLSHYCRRLFQISLAVCGWLIRAREPLLKLVRVWCVIRPACRPSISLREVSIARVPVKSGTENGQLLKAYFDTMMIRVSSTYAPLIVVPPPRIHPAVTSISKCRYKRKDNKQSKIGANLCRTNTYLQPHIRSYTGQEYQTL
jgi:hypothetical protein